MERAGMERVGMEQAGMERYATLVGRVLLALIFIMSGVSKITNFAGTQEYMAANGMPATALFAVAAIVIEVLGGLGILLGYQARVAAWALIIFMIPVTLIFHTNFADQMQVIHFMKNLAMTGGLLYLATYGAGSMSIDARVGRPVERVEVRRSRSAA